MPPSNSPADYDFLDPDVNLGGYPSRSCVRQSTFTGSTSPAARAASATWASGS